MLATVTRGSLLAYPCYWPTTEAWPLEASGALALVNAARDAAASCATRKALGDHPSPCAFQVAARPGCSLTAFIAASAAEPVAGGKPVSMMQNISDDLLLSPRDALDISRVLVRSH